MTRNLLLKHFEQYPQLQIQDIFKFIYQSSFGCEHMVTSLDYVKERAQEEYNAGFPEDGNLVDQLDGAYSRVHFAYLKKGLNIDTLCRLFMMSAKKEERGLEALKSKLAVTKELVIEGFLPFGIKEFETEAESWREKGYPAVHHSDVFRREYRPAYRVISNEYAAFLPVFAKIDELLAKGPVIVAIEGGSASGKTTLSGRLSQLYDCNVFHMDDFFLRPEQRTPERFAEPGGNIDRERFLEEVLIPLSQGRTVEYRKFDCSTMGLCPQEKVEHKKLTIIEGAYSMHPELSGYYDASIFLDITPELQRVRIAKRNSPQFAERFYNEWIPLETVYFEKMQVKEKCGLIIECS